MKKVSRKKLIDILSTKNNYTYSELAKLTGYHPKSLIRINGMLKRNNYISNIDNKKERTQNIITDYLHSGYKTYKDFYKSNNFNYDIAYSTLCNILNKGIVSLKMVLIIKSKINNMYVFNIIDYQNKTLLFSINSERNYEKTIKKVLYILFKDYGCPQYITFRGFFDKLPYSINNILSKYNVKVLDYKSCYNCTLTNLNSTNKIKYTYKKIIKEDFYNMIVRKATGENIIQFNNIRYKIVTNIIIKRNTSVMLYYDDLKTDLFIKYNKQIYNITPIKFINSKKGNSKYSY